MANDDKRIKSEGGQIIKPIIMCPPELEKEIMKELFYALYFSLHFVGAFLGLIIAIHVSTWLGLSMFAFFIIKFLIMMPDVMEKV